MEHFEELFALLSDLEILLNRRPAFTAWVEYNRFYELPLLHVASQFGTPLSVGTLDEAISAAEALVKRLRKTVTCEDCYLPYTQFDLDTHLPDAQWQLIAADGARILCPNCIAKRAARLPNVVLVEMRLLNAEDKDVD